MAFAIKPRQRLVFAGDSVTDAYRRGDHAPLGNGYVRVIDGLIAAKHPKHRVKIINSGVGGDTIRMLAARWDADVIAHDPQWVTVLIGANDAWGYLINREGNVPPDEYREFYSDLLDRLRRQTRAKLVLMDSFIFCDVKTAKEDHVRMANVLPKYRATVAVMAKQFKARHVRIQEIFKPHQRQYSNDELAPDAVHPTLTAHTILAHAWLTTLGW